MAEINNLHEFVMPIGEVDNDYSMKHAEILKDLMSQMDVKGQDDHRAKIAEREYWRKLRGDILLALINKSTPIDLSPALPEKASDFTERLYRQDKDFFSSLEIVSDCLKQVSDEKVTMTAMNKQEPDDKVKHKFEVGEWLCENELNNYARFIQILEIVNVVGKERYRISRDLHNDEDIVECKFVEDNWHPFNIKDAKPGDVLVCKGNVKDSKVTYKRICLFENLDKAFFTLTKTSNDLEEYAADVDIDYSDNTVPATKEQKEILFMTMKEVGYKFDAEKKELKKIEQNTALDEKDERIRKELITFFQQFRFNIEDTINAEEVIAWLEKQGDKPKGKTALEAWKDMRKEKVDNKNCAKDDDKIGQKFKVGDIVQYITDSTDRRKIEEIDTLCNMYNTDSSPIMFEIEDEWKVVVNAEDVENEITDKLEPKFKVGDWVVWQDKYYKVNYNGCGYELVDQNGLSTSLEYGTIDENAHLWTTKDAKPGDVLASECCDSIILFKGIKDNNIDFYCDYDFSKYNNGDKFAVNNRSEHYGSVEDSEDFHPATKEQYDTLMKAITDAGYEWDAENKETKKIEDESKNYKQQVMSEMTDLVKDYIKLKPSWTEDDERLRKTSIAFLQEFAAKGYENAVECMDWLKSLKNKIINE